MILIPVDIYHFRNTIGLWVKFVSFDFSKSWGFIKFIKITIDSFFGKLPLVFVILILIMF